MDIMAPMIRTMPMILNTESPVALVLLIAERVALPAAPDSVGMLSMVTKKANIPTARIIKLTTTPIMAPGSMNPNFVFMVITLHSYRLGLRCS